MYNYRKTAANKHDLFDLFVIVRVHPRLILREYGAHRNLQDAPDLYNLLILLIEMTIMA